MRTAKIFSRYENDEKFEFEHRMLATARNYLHIPAQGSFTLGPIDAE